MLAVSLVNKPNHMANENATYTRFCEINGQNLPKNILHQILLTNSDQN
jgi:hypothetical protein